jgi:hypothetical protein
MARIDDLLRDDKLTVLQILERLPIEDLGDAVEVLKRHRPPDEVCRALMFFIATAPLADFQVLQEIYRRSCR